MNRNKEEEQTVPLTNGADDDLDSEYGSQSSSTPFNGRRAHKRRSTCRTYCCTVIGYAVFATIFIFIGAQITRHNLDLDRRCSRYTTKHSPLVDHVAIKYTDQKFNGTFMKEDIYRQPASPEVDEAWTALGVDARPGIISKAEGFASGLGPGHVQVSEKYGGGFIVNVEAMHHLHCLNLLRQSLYFNYPYYKKLGQGAFVNGDDIVQLHVTHCLDTVRQVLMCNADTGILGQVWSVAQGGGEHSHQLGQHPSHPVGTGSHADGGSESHDGADGDNHRSRSSPRTNSRLRRDGGGHESQDEGAVDHDVKPQAFPDFKTVHKCKNFDAIREYALAIQAPDQAVPPDFFVPADPDYIVMGTP
ncbi:uncharacterized protein B0I36DRAFT_321752 [Microdochium trichocladiopsis]|uniref:Tat pathway signal sequence n=1 Tax=Microdochium trichocladiopsis TaxID=1682393 RepID=A0A9P8YCK3_9PEZI|nr:uncharacterized protein B0I36DRAFT_321752 [Microdochium trichocladiopsis]KAH7033608.1 hypothetical protein B0I36DRAFT_321752 [Microdochium trichocladiopsis]